ncbi:MAG: hypothetical protein IPG17_05075 [Sandaracinaceae bacterium]|nr:hypothetical protein [Sandaracinaceae bacterium]MBK7152337.1 hypothetical protein [Sandaracinaceae bacterium]MBK7774525.1 hypothetical protein [Sandaracinaceae bacterium]MBK8410731.1 hypothetical protein [Sandaracinaceae bacterium]
MSRRPPLTLTPATSLASLWLTLLPAAMGCGGGGGDNTPADQGPRPDRGVPAECDYVHDSALSQGEPAALAGTTEAHNVWRHRVGLDPLEWDDGIADHAQDWADHLAATNNCGLEHSSNADRANIAGFSSLGQNLAGSTGGLSGVGATTNWASERSEYDFGTPVTQGNFGAFGHYTQIVWADTTALGCGVATCGGATVVVCEYGTAGNFLGETPYGEATGECLDLDNDDILQGDDADDTAR